MAGSPKSKASSAAPTPSAEAATSLSPSGSPPESIPFKLVRLEPDNRVPRQLVATRSGGGITLNVYSAAASTAIMIGVQDAQGEHFYATNLNGLARLVLDALLDSGVVTYTET